MLIAGISLQLLAGIIFGLTRILPECRFQSANERLRRFLLFSSRSKYRLRVPLLGALIIPAAASLIVIYMLEASNTSSDVQWYETVGGVLLGSLMAATFYLLLLRRIARLLSKTKDFKNLLDDAYFRTLLFSNLILIPILAGLTWFSYWGFSSLSGANIGGFLGAIVLFPSILFILLGALSFLAAYISLLFILLAAFMKLVSLMARADRILWMIVLSVYVLGGAFLIASAVNPNT